MADGLQLGSGFEEAIHDLPLPGEEHHAVLEPVVGHRDALAVDQQAGIDHLLRLDALGRERVAQGEAFRGGIAEAELALGRRVEPAVGEIAARPRADGVVQGLFEQLLGERHHLVQRGALFLPRLALGVALRHVEPGHAGEALDRLGEGEPLDLDQEAEDVAVPPRREIVVELLLIIDEKRRRLFRAEGREAAPLAPLLAQFHPLADDLRDRQAGADFVQELGREFHPILEGRQRAAAGKSSAFLSPLSTGAITPDRRP